MPDPEQGEAGRLERLWASCGFRPNRLSWALVADRPRISMERVGNEVQVAASGVGVIGHFADEDAAWAAVLRFQVGSDMFVFDPALLDSVRDRHDG